MVLTLVGGSNTPFPPIYFSGTRTYLNVIRARVSRRHPSYRPVHHRYKAFIELFIPTPNMTQSDSGIITAMHDWSRNTRFHARWGNAIVNSWGYLALHQTHTKLTVIMAGQGFKIPALPPPCHTRHMLSSSCPSLDPPRSVPIHVRVGLSLSYRQTRLRLHSLPFCRHRLSFSS